VEFIPHSWKYSILLNLPILPHSNECVIVYNVTLAGTLHYCGILNYSPLIEMLNLIIWYTHCTLKAMLHSGKCRTAVASINRGFFGIVAIPKHTDEQLRMRYGIRC
jgi:hypothetical protein